MTKHMRGASEHDETHAGASQHDETHARRLRT